MKRFWQSLMVLGIVLAATVAVVWFAHGSNMYTKDKVQVVVKTKNEIFGTEEEHIEWKDEFHLGLEYGAPVFVAALLMGFVGWRMAKK